MPFSLCSLQTWSDRLQSHPGSLLMKNQISNAKSSSGFEPKTSWALAFGGIKRCCCRLSPPGGSTSQDETQVAVGALFKRIFSQNHLQYEPSKTYCQTPRSGKWLQFSSFTVINSAFQQNTEKSTQLSRCSYGARVCKALTLESGHLISYCITVLHNTHKTSHQAFSEWFITLNKHKGKLFRGMQLTWNQRFIYSKSVFET